MGPKAQQLYTEYQKAIKDLLNDLKSKGVIKQAGSKAEFSDILQIFGRIQLSEVGLNKLYILIGTADWQNLVNDLSKYNIEEKDVLNFFSVMLFNQILDLFELLKTALLSVIQQSTYNKTTIMGNETLGQILVKIDRISPNYSISKYVDKKLRNAIGHGWYWVKNDIFYYKADNTTYNLSIAELFIKLKEINLLTKCFVEDGVAHLRTLGFTAI